MIGEVSLVNRVVIDTRCYDLTTRFPMIIENESAHCPLFSKYPNK
ncbi:MAG: D-lyxose/D-mannose family sugar isomerase [bacterium]